MNPKPEFHYLKTRRGYANDNAGASSILYGERTPFCTHKYAFPENAAQPGTQENHPRVRGSSKIRSILELIFGIFRRG